MPYVHGWVLYLLIAGGIVGLTYLVGCFCAAGTLERTR